MLLKIGAIYVIIFSRKVKNTVSVVKIYKKLVKLRCSKVLLHLKYKVFLSDPNIEFIILAGGKALATDHRDLGCVLWVDLDQDQCSKICLDHDALKKLMNP